MHKHWHLLHRKSALLCSEKKTEHWFWTISQEFSSNLGHVKNTIPFHLLDRDHYIYHQTSSLYYCIHHQCLLQHIRHLPSICKFTLLVLVLKLSSLPSKNILFQMNPGTSYLTSKLLSSVLNSNLLQAETYGLSNIKATHTRDSAWEARNVSSNQKCRENEVITMQLTKTEFSQDMRV